MRLSLLLVFIAYLFSCSVCSNEHQTRVYSTHDGKFIISKSTLDINLKPYVSQNKVKLTHAIKYRDVYYCLFTDKKESYSKYFFEISTNGTIKNEVKLPIDINNCYYLDLFVLHDTIFCKPYMNHKSYYLNLQLLKWVEVPKPDDVIYEDDRYYVTYMDFGEWGSSTWFKDKLSGKEYELSSSASIINRIDNSYYVSGGSKVLKIDNPLNLKQCNKEYYYQVVKSKKYSNGTNSQLGAEIIYEDTTYSQWRFKEPNIYIATSFKVNNKLFYFCTDSTKSYIAKLENKKMMPILCFDERYSTFDWYYSYRCKIQNYDFQLLKFSNDTNDKIGFVEINENKIKITHLNFESN